MMNWDAIFEFFKTLDENGGWFFDFLSFLVAGTLAVIVLIYFYRLARGDIDWFGRKIIDQESIEETEKIKMELQEQLTVVKSENAQYTQVIQEQSKKLTEIQNLFTELDSKYDDETYFTSQVMYAAQEVAAAIAATNEFEGNRDDTFDYLLDYLINSLKGFREKNPRIVIHVQHSKSTEKLSHYVHSSGHSPRVKEYEPIIDGSAAGRCWRTNKIYYIPDTEQDSIEYERIELVTKQYRSLLCIPIHAGPDKSKRIGVMSLTGREVHAYEQIEIERAVLFSYLLYPLIYTDLKNRGALHG
ncbi:GAF domain-containing protein [Croceifilum oryzae]|uniref:GAF domain-containing protein n=1 Tax=Croceifilum oryzae TaxID=1553429 RepID=A0AAJ1TEQ1_9BACL|nr:GAF domain-containing protein [Croceifilum oryzae]MDQ0417024.1 GAF domain-containing protein [Croceifilum oryzae]